MDGALPRVLTLVPSEARQAAVVDAAAAQPGDAWDLFQVVPYDDALPILTGDGS